MEIIKREYFGRRIVRLWVWAVILTPFLLGLGAFGSWVGYNQGRVDIVFRNIPNSQDYHIAARIFDGFWFKEAVVTRYYASGKPRVPRRGDTVETRWLDIDGDGVKEIILEGWYRDAYHATHILRREGSGFKRVDHFEQYGGREEAFAGLAVYFLNADQDDDLEVIKRHVYSCRDYPGCPNETWRKYYDLGPDGLYHFTKVEKTPQRKEEAEPSVVF